MQIQFDAQSLLARVLTAIIGAALVFGLIFFFLPVMIVVLLILAAVALGLYLYSWFTGKSVIEFVSTRKYSSWRAQYGERKDDDGDGVEAEKPYQYTSHKAGDRIETSDKKRWRMDDVEDVQSR